MTCRTQTQYLVKALVNLKKSNCLYCLIQWLSNDFDKRDYYCKLYKIGCAKILHKLPLKKFK
jgi:hypothetical protein